MFSFKASRQASKSNSWTLASWKPRLNWSLKSHASRRSCKSRLLNWNSLLMWPTRPTLTSRRPSRSSLCRYNSFYIIKFLKFRYFPDFDLIGLGFFVFSARKSIQNRKQKTLQTHDMFWLILNIQINYYSLLRSRPTTMRSRGSCRWLSTSTESPSAGYSHSPERLRRFVATTSR